MTTKLPDELVEKVARAMMEKVFHEIDVQTASLDWTGNDVWGCDFGEMAFAALEALDLIGLIDDLRFYGDEENYGFPVDEDGVLLGDIRVNEDQGQRARTRLQQLLQEGEG